MQIGSIFQQLKQFNSSLANLSEQIKQASKLGEELDTKARGFEDNDKMYEAFAKISEELVKLQKEGTSLDKMITPLEEKVKAALDTREKTEVFLSTSHIRVRIWAHFNSKSFELYIKTNELMLNVVISIA